jgi:NDP-sugar pyrophosphorylase family protein
MIDMILAAGEGERFRPSTKYLPELALPMAGRPFPAHIIYANLIP